MSYDVEPILWAGVVHIEDRKVLTIRESDKDFNLIPGGKLEFDEDKDKIETDEEAAAREVREELGVEVVAETLKFYRDITEPSKKTGQIVRFRLFFGTLASLPDPDNLPGKTVSVAFIDSNYGAEGILAGGLLSKLVPLLVQDGYINQVSSLN
jgi:8-oxo-dGTP pyrophosphatase MutT (NUDIX family)